MLTLLSFIWQTQRRVKSRTRRPKHIKHEVRAKEWRNSEKTVKQFALYPKEMLWHVSDHRQPSIVKWLWIAARGQNNKTTGPERGEWCWQGRRIVPGSRAGGYHGPGQPLATCSSARSAWIITFHSVIFHHGSLQTDNWDSREAPHSGVPADALRRGEREWKWVRERENPCTLGWKGWRRMDKNTLSVDLKRRLMAAMKKKKEMCFWKERRMNLPADAHSMRRTRVEP